MSSKKCIESYENDETASTGDKMEERKESEHILMRENHPNNLNPKVGYVYDPKMGLHEKAGHHEQPGRIYAIYNEFVSRGLIDQMIEVESREVTNEELNLAHNSKYIKDVENYLGNSSKSRQAFCRKYDGDVFANKYTLLSAKLSAGSAVELATKVASGELESGFAIVRPPGHHAERDRAMGFCFYNNIAITAKKIRNIWGKEDKGSKRPRKVAVVDFDVHYGNGTHQILFEEENITFASVHRHDEGQFYPGTGETSLGSNCHNFPIDYSKGTDHKYISIFEDRVIPLLKKISPDIILVSAGFDAAEGDPLGGHAVTPEGYYTMSKMMQEVCPRMVFILEGGYNLDSIAKSAAKCVEVLLEHQNDLSEKFDNMTL